MTGPGDPTSRQIAQVIQDLAPRATIRDTGAPDKDAMPARGRWLSAITRDLAGEPRVRIKDGVRRLFKALAKELPWT